MSECACVYTSDDGDMPTFTTTKMPKARKSHRCDECGDTIAKGATYQCVSGKWGDSVDTYRTCLVCVEIRGALFCESWCYGSMWSDVEEHWADGGNPLGCITELDSAAAKEKLAAKWREFAEIPAAREGAGQ